jgi:hypothetical protein
MKSYYNSLDTKRFEDLVYNKGGKVLNIGDYVNTKE